MLYLFLERNRLKGLYVKKTLLGQYESAFYEKKHTVDFLDPNGIIGNSDLLASAIKEATTTIAPNGFKDKDVYLILPQTSFHFMRAEVPADIAPTAISSFVRDKARTSVAKDLENYHTEYLVQDNGQQKQIVLFAVDKELLKSYQDVLQLIDLQLVNILPESLAYFKLFEKTLRKDKRENILYAVTDTDTVHGYLFDTYGPIGEAWEEKFTKDDSLESILKEKTATYEKEGKKLNRLILSGENSDSIRQDTFTKNVGVWTNPLKRIIPQFYQDYLKIFIIPADKTLPLLRYDVCIGAFIFSLENKNFSLIKKRFTSLSVPSLLRPTIGLPFREILIFVVSFVLSFIAFIFISRLSGGSPLSKMGGFLAAKPTTTPIAQPPTPTPTIVIDKKTVKVKVLNGSGVKGKASEIKDLLKEKGYQDILTDNADNFDYTVTEIQIKKSRASLTEMIKNDLKDKTSPKVTQLAEDEAADLVIIFGADFK